MMVEEGVGGGLLLVLSREEMGGDGNGNGRTVVGKELVVSYG